MGLPARPEPCGANVPVQRVPRLNRTESPGPKVAALAASSEFHGVVSPPSPFEAAEQSTWYVVAANAAGTPVSSGSAAPAATARERARETGGLRMVVDVSSEVRPRHAA